MTAAKHKLMQWIENVEKRIDERPGDSDVELKKLKEEQLSWKEDEAAMEALIDQQIKRVGIEMFCVALLIFILKWKYL